MPREAATVKHEEVFCALSRSALFERVWRYRALKRRAAR